MPNVDHALVSEQLSRSLDLLQPPVAVCLTDRVPDGIEGYSGAAPAGCRFWQEAATRPFATGTADHELCAVGIYTHNLAEPSEAYPSELGSVVEVMDSMGYLRAEDVPKIPVLRDPVRHVIYAPLDRTPLEPDVVLLFVHARDGLVVTEAVQQVEPGMPPVMGRPACAVVPQVVNTGRAALTLGCCGARAYLDVMGDDVALWALPGADIASYAERIGQLAEANARLMAFHGRRREDVARGERPAYAESMAKMSS